MSRSIDRVTTFHLGNRDEISHMNGLQNSSRLQSHPGNRDHMKRPSVGHRKAIRLLTFRVLALR